MAAGWNAKLILHACSPAAASSAVTTIGLAVAARHTGGRYVCAVVDERAKSEYVKNLQEAGVSSPTEVIVGEAEMIGVDFVVLDCKRKDFGRVLRLVKVSEKGAILVCKSTWPRDFEKLIPKGTRVVRSVSLPVGQGLSIIHIGSSNGGAGNGGAMISTSKSRSRWTMHVDERSGEEHVYRERI